MQCWMKWNGMKWNAVAGYKNTSRGSSCILELAEYIYSHSFSLQKMANLFVAPHFTVPELSPRQMSETYGLCALIGQGNMPAMLRADIEQFSSWSSQLVQLNRWGMPDWGFVRVGNIIPRVLALRRTFSVYTALTKHCIRLFRLVFPADTSAITKHTR